MTIKAPFLRYGEVGKIAEDFLLECHPSLELPIPIEYIIEFNLELNIVPMPNLYRTFRQSGFLSFDRTTIFIDEYQYDNFVEKYRFTLAHEIGHFVLHKALYEGLHFESMQEYIEYLATFPSRELHWFETQAEWFAGQILVPTSQLEKQCIKLLESNKDQFCDGTNLLSDFWSYASNVLAESFDVNPIVVEIRIDREGLSSKYRDYYLRGSAEV
jgi:hypothetical protein